MWRPAALAAMVGCLLVLPATVALAEDHGAITATVTVAGDITVELRVPRGKVNAGRVFKVEARVRSSERGLALVQLKHPDGVLIRGTDVQAVHLRPGRTSRVRWYACVEIPGQYVLLANVQQGSQPVAESAAETLKVTRKKSAECPGHDHDDDDDDERDENDRGKGDDDDD